MSASEVNANHWSLLSPEVGNQYRVSTHIHAGTLAIMCWDILNNLKNDYRLLFKSRVGLPTVAYFVSRLGVLGFILTVTVIETAPIGSCKELQQVISWTYVICLPATSLLFFFRVRAVFSGSKYVVWFFSFMWLAVLGAALTVPRAIFVMNIGPTRYCATRRVEPFAVVAVTVSLVNDTLVLLATTVGFVMHTHQSTLKEGFRTMMYGDYLPAFSRAMLRDNQMYYLATVGCNLLTLVIFYINSLPGVYRTTFMVPNAMLMNIMACRVFRNTKFGDQRADPTVISSSRAIVSPKPNTNFSGTHALRLLSRNGNQARGSGCVEGGKLGNADMTEIYSPHIYLSEMQEDHNQREGAV